MAKRNNPTEQRTRAKRPSTREKAERAWKLKLDDDRKTLKQIGDELGMSPSGVHELMSGAVGGKPLASIESYRDVQIAQIRRALMKAWCFLNDAESSKAQFDGLRTINQIVRTFAVVSGVVKHAPPLVLVNQFTQGPDLSRLSIDEVESLQRMQTKLLEAPLEAHGEVIDDGESGPGEAADERDDAAAGLGDRTG